MTILLDPAYKAVASTALYSVNRPDGWPYVYMPQSHSQRIADAVSEAVLNEAWARAQATYGQYDKAEQSAADGPWEHGDAPIGERCAPWCDEDEFEFHGVVHTWRDGYGWTMPFEGCVVAANIWDIELPDGIDRDEPGRRYAVDADWDDESCALTLLTEQPA